MATGNHLTVRDYFDQVLVGRKLHRRTYSRQNAVTAGGKSFHQILASRGSVPERDNINNFSGLKIVDYLKNPVRIKCRYNYRSIPPKSKQVYEKTDKTDSRAGGVKPDISAAEPKAFSQEKKRALRLKVQTESASSFNPIGKAERRVIEKSIHKAARKYNLSASLIKGIIRAESNFEPNAVSHAGAQGLMQLMPETAKELGVKNPFDIEQNIDGGARYLRKMLDSFGGDVKVALAAYNAGPGAVEKYGGQIPPYQETEQYVKRVLKFSKQMA
jgi:hypothetical protein